MPSSEIAFVILHYQSIQETIACVTSIQKNMDTRCYFIVIVDNASPNQSGHKLSNLYSDNPKIKVILSEKNLGFARGNNLGFQYAKYSLNSSFIVLLNNDTLLNQTDFFATVKHEFQKSHFAVLGPKIITPQYSTNTNPVRNTILEKQELKAFIRGRKKRLLFLRLHVDDFKAKLRPFLQKFFHKSEPSQPVKTFQLPENTRQEHVQLHGCCLIFSQEYISKFDGLDSRTFMFLEEEILYAQMEKQGLLMVYNPNLEIHHLEDVSTDSVYTKPRQKRLFSLKHQLDSTKILLHVLKEDGFPLVYKETWKKDEN